MAEQITVRLIEQEMKENYVDYAMSVITARALPDVRDGLKPVHRRILYAMDKLGLTHDKAYRKSAFVVGRVMAEFHPHGNQAIYDALMRLAQDFSMRYKIVDGQGNVGSLDGDPPAAERYTEARMGLLAEELLADIDKDTVDFVPNYDGSSKEPVVLPSRIPNLLINGSSGIAVGMATSIPPHNIGEIIDATLALIQNPDTNVQELMQYVKGPDFPTGGMLAGLSGVRNAYQNGRGKAIVKAKIHNEGNKLVVTEIPYMINKALLVEHIASLVKEDVLEDITEIRDESNREGIRIVIELKKGSNPDLVMQQLYAHTELKTSFGIMMICLRDGIPVMLGLKDILQEFIKHRKNVLIRRSQFELFKAKERLHIVEGLQIALRNIDAVVECIKKSADTSVAQRSLMQQFSLSDKQANAILEMRLSRLTQMESGRLHEEQTELKKTIGNLEVLLASEEKVLRLISEELMEMKRKYSDTRRTQIVETDEEEIEEESLMKDEEMVVTLSNQGYIKRMPLLSYRQQKRGGQGVIAAETREEEILDEVLSVSTLSDILFFTNLGRVYKLKAYQIPEASRYGKGKAVINLLNLKQGEKISTILSIRQNQKQGYVMMVTKKGKLKKSLLELYLSPRTTGIHAVTLEQGDELVAVKQSNEENQFIIATKKGMAMRFESSKVRAHGRTARGVRGIKLEDGDEVIGIDVASDMLTLLTITINGYGKRSLLKEYRLVRRGGKGVVNIKTNERNGNVVAIKAVTDTDEVLVLTKKGYAIRTKASDVSVIGRNTAGVRIMKLQESDAVVGMAAVSITN